MRVDLLAAAGFERITCTGPTNFSTSKNTLGFDFVAHKPAAAARSGRALVAALAATAAALTIAAAVLRRRRA